MVVLESIRKSEKDIHSSYLASLIARLPRRLGAELQHNLLEDDGCRVHHRVWILDLKQAQRCWYQDLAPMLTQESRAQSDEVAGGVFSASINHPI